MANPKHVAILKAGVICWNNWRDIEAGDKKLDLSNAELQQINLNAIKTDEGYEGVNLEGTHLKKVNLSGAKLEVANLKKVNLSGAKLEGAYLVEAHLERANLTNAHLEGAKLEGAILVGTKLERACLKRAKLSWANLKKASLFKADLRGALLVQTNLEGAILINADIREADLRVANLENARVAGIKFSNNTLQGYSVQIKEKKTEPGKWILFDLHSKYKHIRVATCYGSQAFKSFAQDQDYLEEFRSKGGWSKFLFWLWYLSCDCGRPFLRWAFWSLFFAMAFAVIICWMGTNSFQYKAENPDFIWAMYYSIVTFTTLGFGDVIPRTRPAAILITLEVILGYIMLGGLISILANKLARRA